MNTPPLDLSTLSPSRTDQAPSASGQGGSVAGAGVLGADQKKDVQERKRRISMSAPVRRLEATQIPGYHLHWFREENIGRAQQAYYDFVLTNEVEVNSRNVALEQGVTSTSDMSDRVTVQFGGETVYLMKLREEHYQEDMAALAEKNHEIWQQIFRGEEVAGAGKTNPGDPSHRYVKEAKIEGGDVARAAHLRHNQPLFNRKYK